MNTLEQARIRAALEYIHWNHGAGDILAVDYDKCVVTSAVRASQRGYGRPCRHTFRYDGRTVYYRKHQRRI